jgi:hypothetical protein
LQKGLHEDGSFKAENGNTDKHVSTFSENEKVTFSSKVWVNSSTLMDQNLSEKLLE